MIWCGPLTGGDVGDGTTFKAPGTDMASIVKYAPSQCLGFLEVAFEPGSAIGNSPAVSVAAFYITSKLDGTRAIGVADVAE